MERPDYCVGVPKPGTYKRIVTTESGDTETVKYKALAEPCDGKPYRLVMPLRPYESVIFEFPKVAKKGIKTSKAKKETKTSKTVKTDKEVKTAKTDKEAKTSKISKASKTTKTKKK